MRKTWMRILLVLFLILLPFGIHQIYRHYESLPEVVRIATGPQGGEYRSISENLAAELKSRYALEVQLTHTTGSLENLKLLQSGQVDFALYQPETKEILENPSEPATEQLAFVANLYSQPAHFIVRRDAGIKVPTDLRGKRVYVGGPNSGDFAMCRILLEHFGIAENELQSKHLSYTEIKQEFANERLDAAFLTIGIQAPIFEELFAGEKCNITLISIPYATALSKRRVSISTHVLPAGLYRSDSQPVPATDIETVSLYAQLLTRQDVSNTLSQEVAEIVLNEKFAKTNNLEELFAQGKEFARNKPGYSIHAGAMSVYEPEIRPWLNPDFVEATEGMRSFAVSILIAAFLAFRWVREQREKKRDHRLDRYIHTLLEIERKQLALDENSSNEKDIPLLQELLDEITTLRQEALGEFTAHQLNEDHATECFIEMCHALSDKISAKLSRQRLDKNFRDLGESLGAVKK